jgi:hypothetical protein
MSNITRWISACLVLCGLLAASDLAAEAAGAIAIGRCNRVGYSFDQPSPGAAAGRALAECRSNGDRSCSVVMRIERICGAFAVSGQGGCGARGWAYAGSRAAAENIAMVQCQGRGGINCRIQAWVCDAGP